MWQSILTSAISVVVTVLLTLLLNGLLAIPKKLKKEQQHKEDDLHLIKQGVQALLKNDLKVRYDNWIDLGYAPEDAKDDLEREYQVYHSLGRNGVMDSRRAKFLQLPTSNDRDEQEE